MRRTARRSSSTSRASPRSTIALGGLAAVWLSISWAAPVAALVAGALGAVVSVIQRINSGKFELEYDVGGPYTFFLGGLRPLIGGVFAMAITFAFSGGLLHLPVAARRARIIGGWRCSSSASSPGSASAGRRTRSPQSSPSPRTNPSRTSRHRERPSRRRTTTAIRSQRLRRREWVVSKAPEGLAVRTQKRYGWRPDTPDMRDYLLAVEPAKTLPRSTEPAQADAARLRPGAARLVHGQQHRGDPRVQRAQAERERRRTPSRLFIYYNERAMEGTVAEDSGAEIRDGIKSVAQLGAPPETDWPYESPSSRRSRPPRRTGRR